MKQAIEKLIIGFVLLLSAGIFIFMHIHTHRGKVGSRMLTRLYRRITFARLTNAPKETPVRVTEIYGCLDSTFEAEG